LTSKLQKIGNFYLKIALNQTTQITMKKDYISSPSL